MRRVTVLLTAAVMTIGGASGCSFIFTDGPPADHKTRRYFDCTSSKLSPAGDMAVAGLVGVGMLGSSADRGEFVEGGLVMAALLASAAYGLRTVERCQSAKVDLVARLTLTEPPPQPNAPQPQLTLPARPADPWMAEGPPPGARPDAAAGEPARQ